MLSKICEPDRSAKLVTRVPLPTGNGYLFSFVLAANRFTATLAEINTGTETIYSATVFCRDTECKMVLENPLIGAYYGAVHSAYERFMSRRSQSMLLVHNRPTTDAEKYFVELEKPLKVVE
mgnify:CR=1 FL=1